MGPGTALLLTLLTTAATLYALYFVVRAAVEAGIRRALPSALLQPSTGDLVEARQLDAPATED